MDELSTKSDQELFYIYRGGQNPRPIRERYLAARILESRDFRFKEIHSYITKWEMEKYEKTSPNGKFKYRIKLNQADLITLLMFLAIIFLGIVVIVPVFFPNSNLAFPFSGDVWFFLNILSFLVFFYIFGFIGYFIRAIKNFRKQRKMFEIFHSQIT
jgi:VIT1/CCC1 family predicted Fe2+/Mn2+ transporter